MSFWLHDEMVSLDLLESLPGVDKDNLGVVGCSGGGTQSSYLGAMDPRVKVSTRILGRFTAPSHLFLFLTASCMVLPQDPSTDPTWAPWTRA